MLSTSKTTDRPLSRPATAAQLRHASRNLPRYTSYPTALAFQPGEGAAAPVDWFAATRAEDTISAYVHVPFCRRLCWYCGCNTTVAHEYDRIDTFQQVLEREIDLLARALGPHAGVAHLHFGGGSPNALSPEHFLNLADRLYDRLGLRADAEIAVELDPALLSDAFVDALGEAGVTRASLGVQTFDPIVQEKVNRIQPYDRVAASAERLRAQGVRGLNFDLMYGLPAQNPENVAESVELALTLKPDRIAVFGYAHVPWMKKHQVMIQDADLADVAGRWAQAEAADQALVAGGYVRIGLDHYARPEDPLAIAAAEGRLRRNFQGYTDDPAPVLVPVGPSSIGQFREGFVQNAVATDTWGRAVLKGELPLARKLPLSAEDRLRAAIIERLMCDLAVDVGAVCQAHGVNPGALDASVAALAEAESDGLCRIDGRRIEIPEGGRRLMRVVAAAFDERLPVAQNRHAKAV
ncbi:MAG: oxygen-independent coproporphyrinogen III oxidase [Phenylobacterium sp. RIFCSPHIGHO2_01_FULL_69_31]|uniref:oxygen-independent coproporphyrinogen III oxidase n=1 Tax=Phenylobacterium sp. RIFCSPHIGHO2_01_FULL_69_31 TaxID=1801944 RepID=UPI0008C14367|nr:oxygen-independent coproporphyrinogen III oxidase [Phenylobacterium sp. RIFCSPHIGHO2_01_FULL_69_31]OHB31507.1 MAG: oxygen-independent coproporphyrinogen III oxidase [Phenylobacterium sp. RIFCSPHIGHO2_01_FULL_69_31]